MFRVIRGWGSSSSFVLYLSFTMKRKIPVYELYLPEYQVDKEPDHEAVGKKVDDFMKQHFMGEYTAVRCLGSSEHPGKSVDELIEVIRDIGHDRYDPNREGDRYENNEGREIDFFAFDYHIDQDSEIFRIFTWPFYHWCQERSGYPVRIDIILLYDSNQLEQIEFSYPGREDEGMRSDGFVFKYPDDKTEALKGIVKIS
jgi:hypothetical protein